MIVTKLHGGLGNQMFQYAIGRCLAEKNNTVLKLDLSFYNNPPNGATPREYSLDFFKIKKNIASDEEIKNFKKYERKKGRKYFFHNLFFSNSSIHIKEKTFNFNNDTLKKTDEAYLDGYWQSEKYFKNIEDIIHKEFTLKDELNENLQKITGEIKKTNSISLHIRRGDYANDSKTNSYHGLCPMAYYNQAIKKITDEIKEPVLFIFSDDIDWVKENLKTNFPVAFIKGNRDYEDLILMSLCKHNIIANSSFSWWGAWLNKNPDKIVVAPKNWFNDLKINSEDLMPNNWFKI